MMYTTAGFAVEAREGQKLFPIDAPSACLMCGNLVAAGLLTVHRASCPLPKPFDVREYARRLCVQFTNVKPAEDDPLSSSSPANQ